MDATLAALELSVLPVWVYDHDRYRFRWANKSALELWRASSLDELLARDFSDSSPSTMARLDSYLQALRGGEKQVSEDWTLYPRGQPATMTLHGSGITVEEGRLAILFQAVLKGPDLDPSMVRAVEALRHTSLLVSMIDESGGALYHNPAVLRSFGGPAALSALLPDTADALLGAVKAGHVYRAEQRVKGPTEERWHAIEARAATDPVTGARAVLVQQLDVTDRRAAEELAETRSQLLEELRQTLDVVERQRQEILSLSAPIIDVGQFILALPIIGELSRARAEEVTRRLLLSVQAHAARFVIVDLTGCAGMDEAGARALRSLLRATELLGARAIITGVGAALARALLGVGEDLSSLETRRTLRDGLELCRG